MLGGHPLTGGLYPPPAAPGTVGRAVWRVQTVTPIEAGVGGPTMPPAKGGVSTGRPARPGRGKATRSSARGTSSLSRGRGWGWCAAHASPGHPVGVPAHPSAGSRRGGQRRLGHPVGVGVPSAPAPATPARTGLGSSKGGAPIRVTLDPVRFLAPAHSPRGCCEIGGRNG